MPETPTDTISTDLPCATCGYNLRTLSPSALCPECATPVSQSIHAFRATHGSSPKRLAWGAALIAVLPTFEAIYEFNLPSRLPLPSSLPMSVYRVLTNFPGLAGTFSLALGVMLCASSRPKNTRFRMLSGFFAICAATFTFLDQAVMTGVNLSYDATKFLGDNIWLAFLRGAVLAGNDLLLMTIGCIFMFNWPLAVRRKPLGIFTLTSLGLAAIPGSLTFIYCSLECSRHLGKPFLNGVRAYINSFDPIIYRTLRWCEILPLFFYWSAIAFVAWRLYRRTTLLS